MNDWADWVGRQTSSTEWLDPAQANRMRVTLDRDPDLTEGDPLPPAWHWLYFHDMVRASELGEEGHPRLGITMPPVPLPRRMWAAGAFEFREPLHLGARVTRTSTIRAITPKSGRSGPLCFVTVAHELSANGVECVAEEQTIVYREISPEATLPPPEPAPDDAQLSKTWRMDNTSLFRYSALTFNGHRIHYDADYCRAIEGYPDIVIHGPLLATLLLDLMVVNDKPVQQFSYRARSPLFLPSSFTVNGREADSGFSLWAAGDHGGLAMQAEAR